MEEYSKLLQHGAHGGTENTERNKNDFLRALRVSVVSVFEAVLTGQRQELRFGRHVRRRQHLNQFAERFDQFLLHAAKRRRFHLAA